MGADFGPSEASVPTMAVLGRWGHWHQQEKLYQTSGIGVGPSLTELLTAPQGTSELPGLSPQVANLEVGEAGSAFRPQEPYKSVPQSCCPTAELQPRFLTL